MSSSVPALHRGLDVLEYMAEKGSALTLTQLARAVGRRVPEIQRTAACLHERGYLTRDSAGIYRLSTRLFRMAHANPAHRELVGRAYPSMVEFARGTGESVHLSILVEDRLLLVAEAPGSGFARVTLQIGSMLDPRRTVSGRILMAFADPLTLRARPAAAKTFAAIRKQRYEFRPSGYVEGILDLGVPVLMPDGTAIAALTCSWLQFRREKPRWKKLLPVLQSCAGRIASNF